MSAAHRCTLAAALLFTAACAETDPQQGETATTSASGSSAASGGGGEPTSAATSGPGGSEAGSTGGAPTATGGGGPSGLGCDALPDALLCDDFESGAIDPQRWSKVESNGGTVSVQSEVVRHGEHALRIHLPSADAAEGALRAEVDGLFPLPDNSMFGRAFVQVTPAVPETHNKLVTALGPLGDETAQYRLDCNGGDLNSRYTTPTIDNEIQHGGLKKFGYEMPANTWVCIEWHYDGQNDEMRYWIDGEAVDSMTVLSTEEPPWEAPTFERLDIGYRTFQAGTSAPEYDIYYDSIAIAGERIGCSE